MYTNESMRQLCFRQLFDVAHSMAMAPARHGDFKMLRNTTIPVKHLGTTMAGKNCTAMKITCIEAGKSIAHPNEIE